MDKDKKKTLTISSDLKKKIDTTSINRDGKKSFSIEKKKPYRGSQSFQKPNQPLKKSSESSFKKKNFARKFIEQQATKEFIKKDNKPSEKSKLKIKREKK